MNTTRSRLALLALGITGALGCVSSAPGGSENRSASAQAQPSGDPGRLDDDLEDDDQAAAASAESQAARRDAAELCMSAVREPTAQGNASAARPLCGGCSALGGETGDFVPSGGQGPAPPPECRESEGPFGPDAGDLEPSLAAAMAMLDGATDVAAVWTEPETFASMAGQRPELRRGAFGFAPTTTVHVEVETREPVFVERWPNELVGGEPSQCPDRLRMKATVTLSVHDGSLTGMFDDAVVTVLSNDEAVLTATVDLSSFDGCLDVGTLPGEALSASLTMFFQGERVRGELLVGTSLAEPIVEGTRSTEWVYPLQLGWPDDACPVDLFPSDVGSLGTAVSDWLVTAGSETTSVEFGAPSQLCRGYEGPGESSYTELRLPTTFTWDEHRLEVPLDADILVKADGTLERAYGTHRVDEMDVPAFVERYGLNLDYDPAPDACVSLDASLWDEEGSIYVTQFQCGEGGTLGARAVLLSHDWSHAVP